MSSQKVIAEIRRIANPVLQKSAGKKVDFPVTFTFTQALERLDRVLESLAVLVGNDLLKHEHSIGLLLRNILSDFLPIAYMVKFSRLDELEPKLYSFYKADIKKVESHIERFRKGGLVSQEEADRYHASTTSAGAFHQMVKDYCSQHTVKDFPSNGAIVDLVFAIKPASELANKIQQAYDLWFYYSKYEHIGWYSFDLTRQRDRKLIQARLDDVLRIAVILLGMCAEMLKDEDAMRDSGILLKQVYTREPEKHEA